MGGLEGLVEYLEKNPFFFRIIKNPVAPAGAVLVGYALGTRDALGAIGAASATYLGFGVLSEYILEKKKFIKGKMGKSLPMRVTDFFLENPLVIGIAGAATIGMLSLAGLFAKYDTTVYAELPAEERKILINATLAVGLSTDLWTRMVRSIMKRRKPRVYSREEKGGFVSRMVGLSDKVFEHPFLGGALVAGTSVPRTMQLIEERTWGWREGAAGWEYARNLPFAAFSGFMLGSLGVAVAGSVLHSSSAREVQRRFIQQPYYAARRKLARRKEERQAFAGKVISLQAERVRDAVDLEARIARIVELGNIKYQQGDEEGALQAYLRATRFFGRRSSTIGYEQFLADWTNLGTWLRPPLAPLREPESEHALIVAGFRGLLNEQKGALAYWERLYREHPENANYTFLYAKGLELVGKEREGNALKLRVAERALREGVAKLFARASRNRIEIVKSAMLKTELVVKKSSNKAQVEQEYVMMQRAGRLLSETASYYVPKAVGVLQQEDEAFLVMELEEGNDLYELFETGRATKEDLTQVIDALAFFHGKTDPSSLEEKEGDDVQLTIERYARGGYGPLDKERFAASLQPIIGSTKGLEGVALKDPQPENFWIGDGVGLLDWEAVRPGPVARELASLFSYTTVQVAGRRVSADEKLELVHQYLDAFAYYRRRTLQQERGRYELAFYNWSVLRPIQWYPLLVERKRGEVIDATLANAEEAIGLIARKFQFYFERYREEYRMLGGLVEYLEAQRMSR